MKNREHAVEWLHRARSSLLQARLGRSEPGILIEDLCYHAQQAVEKALKAVCIHIGIDVPKVHDIGFLIDLLAANSMHLPEELNIARTLTVYAVTTRYPGDYPPVSEADYASAIETAENVVRWASREIEGAL